MSSVRSVGIYAASYPLIVPAGIVRTYSPGSVIVFGKVNAMSFDPYELFAIFIFSMGVPLKVAPRSLAERISISVNSGNVMVAVVSSSTFPAAGLAVKANVGEPGAAPSMVYVRAISFSRSAYPLISPASSYV